MHMFIALMALLAVLYVMSMDRAREREHRELMAELQALRMQLETPQQRQQRVYGHHE